MVEDSDLIAQAVGDMVVEHGYELMGPVGRVESGLEFVRDNAVDAAVVDIDLHGAASFPICEQLAKRDIPFVFLAGYDRLYPMPAQFRKAPWLQKPIDGREFRIALAGLAQSAANTSSGWGNQILDRLSPLDRECFGSKAEHLRLTAGSVLATARQPVSHVYFPTSGVVSLSACAHGKVIEIALIGSDGVVGLESVMDAERSDSIEMVVQAPGEAWRIPAGALSELMDTRRELRAQLLAAVRAYLAEIVETTLTTANGTIEQRLARRLLMHSLRMGSRQLTITHQALSRLMAVRRSGITVALHVLEGKHLIRSRRSSIEILDYGGLSRVATGRRQSTSSAAPNQYDG
ncbi:MAG: helix-turn-helix domain-containing protein [Enhydrobacter sp.]|nr:helix-turn-helix domain-containing protein [Enhydrobacter sp.]